MPVSSNRNLHVVELLREQANRTAEAQRALLVGWDGSNYQLVRVDPDGNLLIGPERTSSVASDPSISVGSSTTPVLSALSSRISFIVVNDSDEVIYLRLSATAVMNRGVRLNAAGGTYATASYTGAVSAICASGSKNLTVTEL